jgi:cytochrome b561
MSQHSSSAPTPPATVARPERWDGIIKALHWAVALVILIEVPVGYVMRATYGPSFSNRDVLALHELASQFHHTLGYLVLLAALAWLARRWWRPRPAWQPDTPTAQRLLAGSVHAGLLALLVVVPWSGWTALSALADSAQFGPTRLWLLGFDGVVPRIWPALPFDDASGYRRFASIHRWALWAGLGLLALHVLSALWHHGVRRDTVLRRMWPLADR